LLYLEVRTEGRRFSKREKGEIDAQVGCQGGLISQRGKETVLTGWSTRTRRGGKVVDGEGETVPAGELQHLFETMNNQFPPLGGAH